MLLNLVKRNENEAYLSWDEYKKKLIELQIIHMIEKFVKEESVHSNLDVIK